MTTIHLITNDQLLIAVQKPKVASGDVNSVTLHVDFDSAWDGFTARSAVFYTSKDSTPHEMLLADNECTVPSAVLAEAGVLFIGIRGITANGESIKTSTIVKYKIVEGAKTGEATLYPELNMYQQYLAAIDGQIDPIRTELNAKVDEELAAMKKYIDEGFPQMFSYSYEGAGTVGADNPNSVEFPFEPKMIRIAGSNGDFAFLGYGDNYIFTNMGTYGSGNNKATWQGLILSWYLNNVLFGNTVGNSSVDMTPARQLNASGVTYTVFAIG